MSNYEVPRPILNSPFAPPKHHWRIVDGESPTLENGRRKAVYYYRDPKIKEATGAGVAIELTLVNQIREQVAKWRALALLGQGGVTATTSDLMNWWSREDRDADKRLFFAQREAAETIIFLTEARSDLLQGIEIPRDDPSDAQKADGLAGFRRYACKMATGAGKTTVMGMLAAWSILNKVNDRGNKQYSDAVLIVCPNVTIRDRLAELDPKRGNASLYRTRDLVPPHLMSTLAQGHVLVRNWHVFEPKQTQVGGVSAKVSKAGVAQKKSETIIIGSKNTTARGSRYLTLEDFKRQVNAGLLKVLDPIPDDGENLVKARVESVRYIQSDTALLNEILGKDIGTKGNLLIMNDEAHHAYRIKPEMKDDDDDDDAGDADEDAEFDVKEATIWVDGLDKIQRHRGINLCIDLSATPYFLNRVGREANRPFPWVVSDFGLIDAIESGLVKIPQLAIRDNTGADIPGYFNIWQWILPKLTSAERGGKKANPKPEAILKWAHTPIAMLGSLWEVETQRWKDEGKDRPPVFILVCKNTAIAKVIFEWMADDKQPSSIPSLGIDGFRNRDGQINTIRVDSKLVHETDSKAKGDDTRWMRLTLDTVGKIDWPSDLQGRPIYPDGFEELAKKMDRPLHPPGRDIRCIVSVGMLTEGWDCNTVTHVIGLRPFMSQLLCEQVVGRGLRRESYETDDDGMMREEVAKIFGVPFAIIPLKANPQGPPPPAPTIRRVRALPARAHLEIRFPRVEGYAQEIRNKFLVDWDQVPILLLEQYPIPQQTDVKGLHLTDAGKHTLSGPGRIDQVTLAEFRSRRRIQELVFDLAMGLTRTYVNQERDDGIPPHVLFRQLVSICQRYVDTKVQAPPPCHKKDLFLSPFYGMAIERLLAAIRAEDEDGGAAAERPIYEKGRPPGSTADVDFQTRREVYPVENSHVNFVVADTLRWEQTAAYTLDHHAGVAAFVKNAGLGLAIPYMHNGVRHEYVPDFLVRLKTDPVSHLILETKGYDVLEDIKRVAAERWVAAVSAEGSFGRWSYAVAKKPADVDLKLDAACNRPNPSPAPPKSRRSGALRPS